jgi:hypothetical protein
VCVCVCVCVSYETRPGLGHQYNESLEGCPYHNSLELQALGMTGAGHASRSVPPRLLYGRCQGLFPLC